MITIRNHCLAVLAGLSMLLTLPGESHAGLCDWFKCNKCNSCQAPATACNPCQAAQTVSYVPQTSYRCQKVCVPVTAYQPQVYTDPCSGCQVTSYKAVTSFVQQTRMVPYTSYRLVYSNRPCVTCATPVAATTTYVPSTTYVPTTQSVMPATYAAPAACPTCPGGVAGIGAPTGAPSLMQTPGYGAQAYPSPSAMPAAPSNYAQPGYGQPAYAPSGTPSTFAPQAPATSMYGNPAVPATSGYATNYPTQPYTPSQPYAAGGYSTNYPSSNAYPGGTGSTQPRSSAPASGGSFSPPPPGGVAPLGTAPASNTPASQTPSSTQQPLKPIPDINANPGTKANSSSTIRLLDPDNRTTSTPLYRTTNYASVAWNAAGDQPTAPPTSDDEGWRPSSR